ncbi:hypothetical protein SCHPADRAFT_674868 [Schizopora paradoxa]|uniref:WD40 repeat-like protein n=1 Tax=Schizopora paradoxa TaxID=27342 RepID=A0A0H2R4W7_9AGAM|nr:hypothetical protein SCHPADRAFT_674868 [Schizopora paradoxa]
MSTIELESQSRDRNHIYKPDFREYVHYLRNMQQHENETLSFESRFNRLDPIVHMRCSPDGRWLAVCHFSTCRVYDLELKTCLYFIPGNNYDTLAEHVEWALNGPIILTRSKKELKLWRIPESSVDYPKYGEFLKYERRYIFQRTEVSDNCKYIKWLNERDFLLLRNDGAIHQVDFMAGTNNIIKFNRELMRIYQISQVYPIAANSIDKMLCLATKKMPAYDGSIVSADHVAESDGVDYLFYVEKSIGVDTDITSRDNPMVPCPRWTRGTFKNLHSALSFKQLYHTVFRSRRKLAVDAIGYPVQEYEIKHRKLLRRNVQNIKLCRDHKFMIINYAENELGTTAPELWSLEIDNFDRDKSGTASPFGTVKELPLPNYSFEITNQRWGEASFAGQYHDIIVCEVFDSFSLTEPKVHRHWKSQTWR